METVNIFIPHHKNPSLLPPLLRSLREMNQPDCDVQTILVDNASNDGSVERVKSHFSEVTIYSLKSNLGFAPALNRAVHDHPCDWACFLNNDMKVDPHWLSSLMETAKKTHASCVGSILMDWEGQHIQFANGKTNWFGKGFEVSEKTSGQPYPVFFACGGAMMIRRDVFMDAGGFDDEFFMIYEDVDLGWRLWLLGHEVYMAPGSVVYHKGHASLKQEEYNRKAVYLERNSLALLYKNLDAASLSIILPLAVQELHLRTQAYRGDHTLFPYSQDGCSTVSGLQNYLSKLNHWREKRSQVQSRRVLSDTEIFGRFFTGPQSVWAYCDTHYQRIHSPAYSLSLQNLFSLASQHISPNIMV